MQTDAQIDAFIRAKAESAYHPVVHLQDGQRDGSAGGRGPADARASGSRALRVVDSSIMPSITNGNLNAPTIMLAEKAADHIRGLAPLPRASVRSTVSAWQTSQR